MVSLTPYRLVYKGASESQPASATMEAMGTAVQDIFAATARGVELLRLVVPVRRYLPGHRDDVAEAVQYTYSQR